MWYLISEFIERYFNNLMVANADVPETPSQAEFRTFDESKLINLFLPGILENPVYFLTTIMNDYVCIFPSH